MNRRERRAALARGKPVAAAAAYDVAAQFAAARQALAAAQPAQAETICRQILARAPTHLGSLNLLGLIAQAAGEHRPAIKMFEKAIAVDGFDAACHYNIGSSYQLVNEPAAAASHFDTALALGLGGQDAGDLALQNPAIAAALMRAATSADGADIEASALDEHTLAAIANDVFFKCALQAVMICGMRFELFFAHARLALLGLAETAPEPAVAADLVDFACALAHQCFIHEYVFAASDQQARRAERLRARLQQNIAAGHPVSPLLLASVAAYHPLHGLAGASSLLDARWPASVAALLRRQIGEPEAEAAEAKTIAALTAIDDATSVEVRRQYEEDPYPRWTLPLPTMAPAPARAADAGRGQEILIAGCGTGRHAVAVAWRWPSARILAIDLSRASLAYARRKAREAGLANVDFAQADILELGAIGRSFDRIEAVGVLHHLADPARGWRTLLTLLRPHGVMRVGLYSALARGAIEQARALVAARGYSATAEGIRALRRYVMANGGEPHWRRLLDGSADFYCMSGCRDLFFHVMEHRATIPQIAAFLRENGLVFLGFELDPQRLAGFRMKHPDRAALTNLDDWHAFEQANPDTFQRMYIFDVARRPASA